MSAAMDSEAWNRRYAGRELVWTSTANRFLIEETTTLPPGRALDVACGEGRNAVWLAERGWQVTGVDFSEVGLEKARGLARGRGVLAQWVVADLLDYTPEPRAFDLVLVFYLQVPAEQRRAIVRTVAETVAPGGLFLLVAHDSSNLEHGHGGPQNPAVLYTANDVVGDLDGVGLQIERAETVTRPVDTPDGERAALDALVRAHRASGVRSRR
ncbi:MAG: class I SAM-dependent methyltransferase [Solirubrobacteraceae bacterium]